MFSAGQFLRAQFKNDGSIDQASTLDHVISKGTDYGKALQVAKEMGFLLCTPSYHLYYGSHQKRNPSRGKSNI